MSELIHYGIKGQQWGRRRFQNEDGSLTAEGRERYDVGDIRQLENQMKSAKYAVKRSKHNQRAHDISQLKYKKATTDYKNAKALMSINKKNKISVHRANLEKKYREDGMSNREAALAAHNRIKTERLLAVAGVVAVAAISAYAIKRHSASVDKVIPKGMTIQNLSGDTNKGVSDAFYASYKKQDNKKYLSLFGGGHLQRAGRTEVVKLTAEAKDNMKIAGVKTSRDTVRKLLNEDPEYRSALSERISGYANGNENNRLIRMALEKAMPCYNNARLAAQGKAKLSNKGFLAINQMLVDHTENGQKMSSKLYDSLKKNGYDAVLDANDVFRSGYDTKAPVIIFNGREKLSRIARTTISPESLQTGKNKELAKVYLKTIGKKKVPKIIAGVAATKLADKYITTPAIQRRVIDRYKKEHPRTKLSDKEILKNVVG